MRHGPALTSPGVKSVSGSQSAAQLVLSSGEPAISMWGDVEQGGRPQDHTDELLLLAERRGRGRVGAAVREQSGGTQLPPKCALLLRFDAAPRVEVLGLGGDGTQVGGLAGRGDEELHGPKQFRHTGGHRSTGGFAYEMAGTAPDLATAQQWVTEAPGAETAGE